MKRPKIGRRKTVRMSRKGTNKLMSRGTRKKVKRAMYRAQAQSKMLACHACARKDFITEKSLKRHTEKFHTPGMKSIRGFRTRRDEEMPAATPVAGDPSRRRRRGRWNSARRRQEARERGPGGLKSTMIRRSRRKSRWAGR